MPATATAPKITYRKTKAGEWVAMIPLAGYAARNAAGELLTCTIEVSKKDGTTESRQVERYGKPFATSDGETVYAYLHSRIAPRHTLFGMSLAEYGDGRA
jgi:hypothetical protein